MRKLAIEGFHKLLREFLRGVRLILVGLLLSALVSCQSTTTSRQQQAEQKVMTKQSPPTDQNADAGQQTADGFYELLSKKPVKLNVVPREIRRADKTQAFSRAEIGGQPGSFRKFVNDGLNSRLPFTLEDGSWKINWQADLPSSFTPSSVLETKDRIIVGGDGVWSLFERGGGKKLSGGQLGAGEFVSDGENFYAADSTGLIVARSLSDGETVFGLSLYFGNKFERTFMTRRGRRFLAVSTERELDPARADTKENSLVELVDLGEPLKTDADRLLKSAKPLAHLARRTNLLLAAAQGETLVLATQNRVYLADMNLKVTGALTGEFTPLTMSLDEAGRIYLAVEAKNRRSLWVILPTGELAADFEIPSSFGRAIMPPVVGYDHQVYLLSGEAILAVNSEGKLLWQSPVGKKIGGAAVTANDRLLVSAGNELLAFESEGKPRVVFTFPDDTITTSPVLTAGGEILLASKKRLYCLSFH